MGLFNNIFSGLKSDSIDIITNLLELSFIDDNPKQVAKYLVNNVWNRTPDIFEGKFGQHPFKLVVAIYALVKGYDLYPKGSVKDAILISIGIASKELQVNYLKYPLNSLDLELIQEADEICTDIMQKVQSNPLFQDINSLLNK